ncbi:MAG: formylglycine-generating enzyme family protein [Alphaproteobacteria bacterium]|nr:formylglycine-generating enzyme family protein [Alphaproteobacteria bacterium]
MKKIMFSILKLFVFSACFIVLETTKAQVTNAIRVTNGTITPQNPRVIAGQSITFSYTGNTGYVLDTVLLTDQSGTRLITNAPNSITINNVDMNTRLWVKYKPVQPSALSLTKVFKRNGFPDSTVTEHIISQITQFPAVITNFLNDFVFIPGGTFVMGATPKQLQANGDQYSVWWSGPATQAVTLSPYYINKYEVTQALWKVIMSNQNPSVYLGDNDPVENVSWDDVQTFIANLNALTGRNFRLPTEAEWEFAARGGNPNSTVIDQYYYAGGDVANNVGWNYYNTNSGSRHQAVGQKAPNLAGLYDMSGNVYEWCNDQNGNYSSTLVTDPNPYYGNNVAYNYNIRGGAYSFGTNNSALRVSYRWIASRNSRQPFWGFRLIEKR